MDQWIWLRMNLDIDIEVLNLNLNKFLMEAPVTDYQDSCLISK